MHMRIDSKEMNYRLKNFLVYICKSLNYVNVVLSTFLSNKGSNYLPQSIFHLCINIYLPFHQSINMLNLLYSRRFIHHSMIDLIYKYNYLLKNFDSRYLKASDFMFILCKHALEAQKHLCYIDKHRFTYFYPYIYLLFVLKICLIHVYIT